MNTSVFSLVLISVAFIGLTQGRSAASNACDSQWSGCSVERGECVCGDSVACSNPYPYKDLAQCTKDIKGLLDKCRREPCVHGQCVQTRLDLTRRWECACAGSGYHGRKCELECPTYNKESLPVDYPSDCVY